jgi:hypothetical protein
MAAQRHPKPLLPLVFAASVVALLALPVQRRQELEGARIGAEIGTTVGTYVVERDRAADRREKWMLWITGASLFTAFVSAVAAVIAITG